MRASLWVFAVVAGCNAIAGIEAAEPQCLNDGEIGGLETDVDCGGPCRPCPDYASCVADEDCLSNSCGEDAWCAPPRCWDGRKNGLETDVDCGGPSSLFEPCPRCGGGQSCEDELDCLSVECVESDDQLLCRPTCCASDCELCDALCEGECCESEAGCCTDEPCGPGLPGWECDPEDQGSCALPYTCIDFSCY